MLIIIIKITKKELRPKFDLQPEIRWDLKNGKHPNKKGVNIHLTPHTPRTSLSCVPCSPFIPCFCPAQLILLFFNQFVLKET